MKPPSRSLGPVLVIDRRGPHGRRRGKRLALRQLSQRAREHRKLQNAAIQKLTPNSREWARVQGYTAPTRPDGRTIR